MLWRAQLRKTAQQLIKSALQTQGATVSSSQDVPVPSGKMPLVTVYTDDKKLGEYGSEPQFRTNGMVTIEVSVEASTAAAAEAQLDTLCELIQNALLGATPPALVACSVTFGDNVITVPQGVAANIAPGFPVLGQGAGQDNYVVSVNAPDNEITLANDINQPSQANGTGTLQLSFGYFPALFEQIDSVDTFTDYEGLGNANHLAKAVIEIVGHTHERFDMTPALTLDLNGLNIYVDSVNVFDPNGTYTDQDGPFNPAAPAPRDAGPDGRAEITMTVDIPQS